MEYSTFRLSQDSIDRIDYYMDKYINSLDKQLESAKSDFERKIADGYRTSRQLYRDEYYSDSKRIDNELGETERLFKDWYDTCKSYINNMRNALRELIEVLENSNNHFPCYKDCKGVLITIGINQDTPYLYSHDNTSYKDAKYKLPDGLLFSIEYAECNDALFQDSYATFSSYNQDEIEYETLKYELREKFDPRGMELNFIYYNRYGEIINNNNRR